jgi:hypothetical protein
VLARHRPRYREPPVGPARSVATVASTVAWSAAPARFLAPLPRRSRPSMCSLVALRARRPAHRRQAEQYNASPSSRSSAACTCASSPPVPGTARVATPEGVRTLEGAALQVAKPLTAVDDALARLRWILFAVTIGGVACRHSAARDARLGPRAGHRQARRGRARR